MQRVGNTARQGVQKVYITDLDPLTMPLT